jgi:hypothetical protein
MATSLRRPRRRRRCIQFEPVTGQRRTGPVGPRGGSRHDRSPAKSEMRTYVESPARSFCATGRAPEGQPAGLEVKHHVVAAQPTERLPAAGDQHLGDGSDTDHHRTVITERHAVTGRRDEHHIRDDCNRPAKQGSCLRPTSEMEPDREPALSSRLACRRWRRWMNPLAWAPARRVCMTRYPRSHHATRPQA